MRVSRSVLVAATVLLVAAATPATAQFGGGGRAPAPEPVPPLRFRYVGPPSAGRVAAIAGVPGDPSTYYLGAASGGIWKTTDNGETFAPIFDDQPVQAIGALAVAPSDSAIVWAGTGEAWAIRDADLMGDGVYRSGDGGATWSHMGLPETGRIGRIVIHPRDPDTLFVCALGRATGPQQERGVFRTTDGGDAWQRVLFVDENTGCSGLAMDPNDPRTLFAATWEVVMHTWAMFSGGAGSGLHVSRDGGSTWARIDDPGLPQAPVGKVDVAVAPSDSSRVYALMQTADQGSLWRSDDGGAHWRVASWDRRLIGRAGYYIRVAVNPDNADEVLVANSSFHRSLDGGATFTLGDRGCGDCHDIWMDPTDGNRWAVTGDGGAGWTVDHAENFTSVRLPIGQMYHLALDDRVPYWVYSNRQDDGTMRGAVDSPVGVNNVPSYYEDDGIGIGSRYAPRQGGGFGAFGGRGPTPIPWDAFLGGCESGFTIPVPGNPDVVWATCYGNKVTRFDGRTGVARSVEPYMITLDSPPTDIEHRCHWTPPLAIDPFAVETVYYGCEVIFRSDDRGQSWQIVSPDLSTQDPARITFSGGVIGDNLGQFYGEVVFAIAPSPIRRGLIWAGTNDGKLWYTDDGAGTWHDVTMNTTGMPEWGTVRRIVPSHFDDATAYVAVDLHMMDDRRPYLFKTTDMGVTWTRLSDGLPSGHPLDYVLTVAENPNRAGMLFAGTGHGFYISMDDGGSWERFEAGLPATAVTWIEVQAKHHDVAVSTYGRGLFVLSDITTLEQSDAVDADAAAVLYSPRPAFRRARSGSAEFVYSLRDKPEAPVTFDIVDSSGQLLRTLSVPGEAGLHRVTWDLLFAGPRQVELRTVARDNPHIWEEARFVGKRTRPIFHWGINGPQTRGPIAAPGRYEVRMTVDGESLTRGFDVLKDSAIPVAEGDLVESTRVQTRIRDAIDEVAALSNQIEVLRKQVEDLRAQCGSVAVLDEALEELDEKMYRVELNYLSHTEMHSDDKWFVEAYGLYLNLVWLSGEVGLGAGDVAGGADHRPTDASMATLARLEAQLADARAQHRVLLDVEIPAFNDLMRGRLPEIQVEAGPEAAPEASRPS